MSTDFDTAKAFSRNLGWLTAQEQMKLHQLRVGLIGLGGVGGVYAETLARLGVGHFVLCDHDHFAIENTNRQNECRISNYGKNKAEVIAALIKDIHPGAEVTIIPGPLRKEQAAGFVDQIDIYLDTLDFFEIDVRIEVFKCVQASRKTAITSAPIGTGSATLVFDGLSMDFLDYFGFHKTTDHIERSILFLTGIAPSLQHLKYVADRSRANIAERKVPSLGIGVQSCAGSTCATLLKVVLQRGPLYRAPWSLHYDPYLVTLKKNYTWLGYRNPLQKLKVWLIQRILKKTAGR